MRFIEIAYERVKASRTNLHKALSNAGKTIVNKLFGVKDGKLSEPVGGMPSNMFIRGGQGLFEVRPDRAFSTNRTIYLTYTVLPAGALVPAFGESAATSPCWYFESAVGVLGFTCGL